jgi:predicted transcriptional regulator of viral defense system
MDALAWGLKSDWRGDIRLRFADPARTVVDILDSPKIGGGVRHAAEVLGAYFDENDPMVLIDYGDRLGNRAIFKRLGYMAETLELGTPDLIAACLERLSSGISSLDPDGPAGGRRIMRWGLLINVKLAQDGPS